ncbi:hypothetical protein H6G35_24995 [Aulosira sp. FACHB-113]|uniref:hypothetical protein n=1 Tax=Tolypothrix tenuis TaxID=457083 RepID=UPI00168778CD|nr:hypothetical protein [Aulosira sp. FACHB-113]
MVFAIATLQEGSAYVVSLGCGQASGAIAIIWTSNCQQLAIETGRSLFYVQWIPN